jgi:hypothetical protein
MRIRKRCDIKTYLDMLTDFHPEDENVIFGTSMDKDGCKATKPMVPEQLTDIIHI